MRNPSEKQKSRVSKRVARTRRSVYAMGREGGRKVITEIPTDVNDHLYWQFTAKKKKTYFVNVAAQSLTMYVEDEDDGGNDYLGNPFTLGKNRVVYVDLGAPDDNSQIFYEIK